MLQGNHTLKSLSVENPKHLVFFKNIGPTVDAESQADDHLEDNNKGPEKADRISHDGIEFY
jgi:hypothetical protein